jgi:hypothetical protein
MDFIQTCPHLHLQRDMEKGEKRTKIIEQNGKAASTGTTIIMCVGLKAQ